MTVIGKCLCETNTCQTAQICLSLCCSLQVACSVKQTPVIIVILTNIVTRHDRTCHFVKQAHAVLIRRVRVNDKL